MDMNYEVFEEVVQEYYGRFGNLGIRDVWVSICDDFDIDDEDEIYGNWFNEIIEDIA